MSELKSGSSIVHAMESVVRRYIVFPDRLAGQSLVVVLWAIHTWLTDRLPATPYLAITAWTRGAGKSCLLQLLQMFSQNPIEVSTLRPLAMVRDIEDFETRVTYFVDEAEKLGTKSLGDLRSIFTTGANPGGVHRVNEAGNKERKSFRTFCAKAFASIGNVVDVIRDRAIEIHLERCASGIVANWRIERLQGTADRMTRGLVGALKSYLAGREFPALALPEGAIFSDKPRAQEVWCALYTVAKLMELGPEDMARLETIAVDLINLQQEEPRYYTDAQKVGEAEAADRLAGEQALRHLVPLLDEPSKTLTGDIHTAVAVERLRGVAGLPYRTFRGKGLDADLLSKLLGLYIEVNQPVRMERGRKGKQLKGYSRAKLIAALAKLDGKGE